MGIPNFCKLINCVLPPSDTFTPFDAVLIDAQSYLYSAIHYAFSTREHDFFREVCANTSRDIEKVLRSVLIHAPLHTIPTVVLSFDGAGVPMKWPTQRERRRTENLRSSGGPSRKRLYQMSLFGHNRLSHQVQQYVLKKLATFRVPSSLNELRIVLCGCNIPGEGEHKLFQVAELQRLRRPVVISVDQDVFVIALARLDQFESVQVYRYGQVYNLSPEILWETSSYPWKRFRITSFLLGNDFVPAIVHVSDTNVASIHHAMHFPYDAEEDPPYVFYAFLTRWDGLRYDELAFLNRELLQAFWSVFLWMEDYYRRRDFHQLHMSNPLWDSFDRNAILTGLCDLPSSRAAYHSAREQYAITVSEPCLDPLAQVVQDETLRDTLLHLIACDDDAMEDTLCEVLTLSRKSTIEALREPQRSNPHGRLTIGTRNRHDAAVETVRKSRVLLQQTANVYRDSEAASKALEPTTSRSSASKTTSTLGQSTASSNVGSKRSALGYAS